MSNEAFLKQRNLGTNVPRLGDQGRRRVEAGKRGGGGAGKIVAGKFDAFWPGETPIWINISPYSFYEQEIYDKQKKEVIQTATTWFEWQSHYVPRNKGRTDSKGKRVDQDFVCSCGAYKEHPCYGCAVMSNHYAMLDKIEEEKGFRPDKKSPVSRMNKFSLGVTVMEKMYAIPLRDSSGMVRKNKGNGQIIYRYSPAPIAEIKADADELMGYRYQFGHRMHWTVGPDDLGWLIETDDKMKGFCGNCASGLFATHMICPGCESLSPIGKTVMDVDLSMERQKQRSCSLCGEKGQFIPKVECAECGNAVEGRLTSFDVRITRKKTGEKKYLTEIVAIRVPGVPGNADDHKRAMELIQNPLDLAAIFAPTPLDRQKFICGEEMLKGIKPTDGMKVPDDAENPTETESYTDDDSTGEDDTGDNEIAF